MWSRKVNRRVIMYFEIVFCLVRTRAITFITNQKKFQIGIIDKLVVLHDRILRFLYKLYFKSGMLKVGNCNLYKKNILKTLSIITCQQFKQGEDVLYS